VRNRVVIAALETGGESMTAATQLRPVCSEAVSQLVGPANHDSALYHFVGRLIQISLALYLLPAFLVVVMVSGVGILVLKTCRGLANLLEG
jgi:hypothetical protein